MMYLRYILLLRWDVLELDSAALSMEVAMDLHKFSLRGTDFFVFLGSGFVEKKCEPNCNDVMGRPQ